MASFLKVAVSLLQVTSGLSLKLTPTKQGEVVMLKRPKITLVDAANSNRRLRCHCLSDKATNTVRRTGVVVKPSQAKSAGLPEPTPAVDSYVLSSRLLTTPVYTGGFFLFLYKQPYAIYYSSNRATDYIQAMTRTTLL